METQTQSIGRVTLQAAYVGLAVGLLYAVLFQLGVPLCPPSAENCAINSLGPLFAVQLGGIAMVLALPVLAARAGLKSPVTVSTTVAIALLNLGWFALNR
ncbi:hypothetical protein GCM10009745_64620 [Kribbella yunnanensis]|uniref:Uncharacterized protein n=1 Tax=Kribbella yunnanensis TaxID=190194 RepID=A0ABP4UQ02_9ACTN